MSTECRRIALVILGFGPLACLQRNRWTGLKHRWPQCAGYVFNNRCSDYPPYFQFTGSSLTVIGLSKPVIKITRTIVESHHPEAEITFMLLVSIIISTSSLKIWRICYWQTDETLRFQGQISKWREGREWRPTDRYIRVEFLSVSFFFHISFDASLRVNCPGAITLH